MSTKPCPRKTTWLTPLITSIAGIVVYLIDGSTYLLSLFQCVLFSILGFLVAFASDHYQWLIPFVEGFNTITAFDYTRFAVITNLMVVLKDYIGMVALMSFTTYLGVFLGRIFKDWHLQSECIKLMG